MRPRKTSKPRAFKPARPESWQAAVKVADAVVTTEPAPHRWDDAQHLSALAETLGRRPSHYEWADFCQARHEAAVARGALPLASEGVRDSSVRVGPPVERMTGDAWGILANVLADDEDTVEVDADGYTVERKAVA